ncbi:glycosyltransferase [Candidatus Pelagibacter sp.]|nr:glycosyltransferase [Candidatus Pelagibacter sp.]
MDRRVKVSVIVVSLNTKNELEKTLISIMSQSIVDYELIVVDGESNDGTRVVINKYKNKIDKQIIEKDNGIYDAMNKGIKISSGKWIIFMNSGDLFYKKNVLKNFLSEAVKNYDIVYGDTVVSAKNLKYIVNSKPFDYKTLLMPFCHQSVFVKSNILKKRKFSLIYRFSSDFDFFYYCYLSGKKFYKIDNVISKVKSGGFADKNRQMVFNENLRIIKKKGNKNLLYLLYLKKISQYIKDAIRFILPNFIKELILKKKYKNKLVN